MVTAMSGSNFGRSATRTTKLRRAIPTSAAVTIKSVAEHAQVSVATVSRALQQPHMLREKTLSRVMQSVDLLSYTPNAQARGLRTQRSGLIVVLVPNMTNPFFADVIRGIERLAQQHGYSVLLGDTHFSPEREQVYVDMVSARRADGLITFLPRLRHPRGGDQLPAVNACADNNDLSATSVDVDNLTAARDAVTYLVSLGHREIGFISGPKPSPNSTNRLAGYRQAMRNGGLKENAQLIAWGDFSIESGLHGAEALLDRNPGLTAIFCANDEMALGAMKAIKDRGLRIPQDMSVIGFDDLRFAQYFTPPLTTVAQPMDELGREAMRLLLEILEDPTTPPRKRILPASLIVRGSTGRPRS